jgi:hypothetical protein
MVYFGFRRFHFDQGIFFPLLLSKPIKMKKKKKKYQHQATVSKHLCCLKTVPRPSLIIHVSYHRGANNHSIFIEFYYNDCLGSYIGEHISFGEFDDFRHGLGGFFLKSCFVKSLMEVDCAFSAGLSESSLFAFFFFNSLAHFFLEFLSLVFAIKTKINS